jgi:DNA (cytosine-5)-methyltransferase 3A
MNVISLFDGMGCLEIALKEANIEYGIMYTSEVDPFAIKQTRLNFPSNIQLGDARNIDVSKLEHIDLMAGGSPCQSFSFAGKRKGMVTKGFPPFKQPTQDDYDKYLADDNTVYLDYIDYCDKMAGLYQNACDIANREVVEIYTLEKYLELKEQNFEFEGQSYLFWEYMRILTDIQKYNPNVIFLLENVEMGKKWERVLSEAIGVYPVHINSALVCAQNRKRVYWTNIRTRAEGLFGELHSDIPQPKDRGILLKDIIESEVDEKYYIKNPKFGFEGMDISGKSNTMRIGGHASQSNKHNFDIIKVDKNLSISPNQDKASCFTAGGNSGGNHSDMDLICASMVGRKLDGNGVRKDDSDIKAIQRLEPNLKGKTNCLTSVQKDNLVMQLNPSKEFGGQPSQQNRVYDVNGISPALLAQMSCKTHAILDLNNRQKSNLKSGNEKANTSLSTSNKGSQANGMTLVQGCDYRSDEGFRFKSDGKTGSLLARARNDESCGQLALINSRIRRLTPGECCKLQGVPGWYKWCVSDTQQYKMLGNGWQCDTIVWILSFLKYKVNIN